MLTNSWSVLFSLIILESLLVWFSPAERTLGNGIKAVYIHVSLTWAGMLGFTIAGILGLWNVFKVKETRQEWMTALSWVALGSYTVGFAVSLIAAKINWGSVFWSEPRVVSAFQFLILATLIQFINRWLNWHKIQGAMMALLACFLMWSILGTPLVLHPGGPIRESTSVAIQFTFLAMFILSTLIAVWFVWYLHKRQLSSN